MSPGAERIRQFVERKPGEKLTTLLHQITPEALREAYLALKRDAAPGVDGVTWREYGDELDERLLDLHGRVHRGAYRAKPVRRVEIPKPDGGVRPLGVVSLEDKIVQRAVVDNLLNPIYESAFYGFSYGFRPGRSAHDALDALAYAVERRKVSWIVEVDIRDFFGSIDRERLMSFLEMRIGDQRVLRLIRKWLNAGVMGAGLEVDFVRGTPQGAPISPLLANVYLHNVLDDWFAREWRPREARGEAYIVRYADDFVLGFQHRSDAVRFMEALRERFAAFGLELHLEKTRLLSSSACSRAANRRKRGESRPETFDFLGFDALLPDPTQNGRFGLGRKPSAKRMHRTLKAIRAETRRRMHDNPVRVAQWLGRVLRGWLGYYAVPTSYRFLHRFVQTLLHMWWQVLRRRSQRDRSSWERLDALCRDYWPESPSSTRGQRSDLPSGLKAGAGCINVHVRIRAGGGQQWPSLPRKNRMHGSKGRGWKRATMLWHVDMGADGKPFGMSATAYRSVPRQPFTRPLLPQDRRQARGHRGHLLRAPGIATTRILALGLGSD